MSEKTLLTAYKKSKTEMDLELRESLEEWQDRKNRLLESPDLFRQFATDGSFKPPASIIEKRQQENFLAIQEERTVMLSNYYRNACKLIEDVRDTLKVTDRNAALDFFCDEGSNLRLKASFSRSHQLGWQRYKETTHLFENDKYDD